MKQQSAEQSMSFDAIYGKEEKNIYTCREYVQYRHIRNWVVRERGERETHHSIEPFEF